MSVPFRHLAVWSMLGALVLGIATAPTFAQGSGRINGTAADTEGNPLAGVLIVGENPNANPPKFEATTDSDGRFVMLGFQSGQWTFTAILEGYQRSEIGARLTQSRNGSLSFVLTKELHPLEVALGVEALEGLDPDAVTAALSAADALYSAEDWDGAIAGYEALIEKLPMLTNLHLQIGNALRAMGKYDAAIASYERLKAADPSNTEANTEIARTRMAMGDFEAASEDLAAAASSLDASREEPLQPRRAGVCQGRCGRGSDLVRKGHHGRPELG